MRRVLLVLLVCGCESAKPAAPAPPWSPYTPTGQAPLQAASGPPPSYFLVDNVDSNTSQRDRR